MAYVLLETLGIRYFHWNRSRPERRTQLCYGLNMGYRICILFRFFIQFSKIDAHSPVFVFLANQLNWRTIWTFWFFNPIQQKFSYLVIDNSFPHWNSKIVALLGNFIIYLWEHQPSAFSFKFFRKRRACCGFLITSYITFQILALFIISALDYIKLWVLFLVIEDAKGATSSLNALHSAKRTSLRAPISQSSKFIKPTFPLLRDMTSNSHS